MTNITNPCHALDVGDGCQAEAAVPYEPSVRGGERSSRQISLRSIRFPIRLRTA
jgi:hypothetical protein